MNFIVDVQGFKTDDNSFIIKEIAILNNERAQAYLIKPPFPFYELSKTEKRQVCWIERNRKIFWREGFIPYGNYKHYTDIVNILKGKRILAKGHEKVLWLQSILDTNDNNIIVNLEDKGCPSILSLYDKYSHSNNIFSCMYHSNVCALKNVTCLNMWCKDNKFF